MALKKQGPFTQEPNNIPDVASPNYTPSQLRAMWQTPHDELKETFNKLVDDLTEKGAAEIGVKDASGNKSTIQAEITRLNSEKAPNSRVVSVENQLKSTESKLTTVSEKTNTTADKANSIQQQLNQMVVHGDSSVEAAQARVDDVQGRTFATLKDRLDNTSEQLAETETQITKTKQSYKSLYNNLGTKTHDEIFVRKTTENRYDLFVNHRDDNWQMWKITNEEDIFDNFPKLEGGDPLLTDTIRYVNLTLSSDVRKEDTSIRKYGSWSMGSSLYSHTQDDYLEFRFRGRKLLLSHRPSADCGIVEITVDGETTLLDCYGNGSSTLIEIADGLDDSEHLVTIRITGDKSAEASSTRFYFNLFRIESKGYPQNFKDSRITDVPVPIESNTSIPNNFFRSSKSAIEIVMRTNYQGNQERSGSIHRMARLLSPPKFYLDGEEVSFNMSESKMGKEFMVVQEIAFVNGTTDVAKVDMVYRYNKDGLIVRWELEWLVNLLVTSSQNAMFGSHIDHAKFGGSDDTIVMKKDESQSGEYPTDHAIGWNAVDDFVVIFELLNYESNTANFERMQIKGLYVWDRGSGAKFYAPKFQGDVVPGEKWRSIFRVGIKHQNNADLLID